MSNKEDAVAKGIETAEVIVNDLYDLIEEWKKRGISEANITKVLVFLLPEVILGTAPNQKTAHHLLDLAMSRIDSLLNGNEPDKNESVH
tara:strand:- start:79 stop:345 length:267 start_codon:yes stop_codon:yes gene_type:complete